MEEKNGLEGELWHKHAVKSVSELYVLLSAWFQYTVGGKANLTAVAISPRKHK